MLDQPDVPRRWEPGSARSAAYWTLRQHPQGMKRRDLLVALAAVTELARDRVDRALRWLRLCNLVALPGGRGCMLTVPAGHPPEAAAISMRSLVLAATAAVTDCPAGICEKVLSAELQVSLAEVQEAMQQVHEAGDAVPFVLPGAHGGGLGWRPTASALCGDLSRCGPAEV